MASPVPGLHHMQQLLQQHVLSPSQLQTLMKQHSLFQQHHQVICSRINTPINTFNIVFTAEAVSGAREEANRTDHAAIARTTAIKFNTTNPDFAKRR